MKQLLCGQCERDDLPLDYVVRSDILEIKVCELCARAAFQTREAYPLAEGKLEVEHVQ